MYYALYYFNLISSLLSYTFIFIVNNSSFTGNSHINYLRYNNSIFAGLCCLSNVLIFPFKPSP